MDGDTVAVTPSADFVGTLVAVYRVQDATKDPDRQVEGRVRLNVLGVPEAPSTPQVEEVRSETVVLSWTPPQNNGAEITGYTVTSSQGDTFECTTTTCTLDGLTNDVTYTFTVQATNEVGDSKPSPASAEARPDNKPEPPTAPSLEFGDESLVVTWANASYTDRSPITSVNLEISPAPASGETQKVGVTGERIVWEGLANGTAYKVRVQAVNNAPDPSEWGAWSTTMIPAGPPDAPSAPSASRVDTALGGQIDVSWNAPADNGDAVKTYHLDVFQGGSKVKTVSVTGTSTTVGDLDTKSSYTFAVTAENKAGKGGTSPTSNAQTPFGKPGVPTGVKAVDDKGVPVVSWGAADPNGDPVKSYTVRASNGASTSVSGTSVRFTGLPSGNTYTFTVTAHNDAGPGEPSAASNGVKAYGLPTAPRVTWTKTSATDGYFTVSGPSSWNGDTGSVSWTLSGSESRSGDGTGKVDVGGGYGKSYTLVATAKNGAGSTSSSGVTGKTDAPPKPEVRVSDSGVRYDVDGCTGSVCTKLRVNANADFPSGTYQFACYHNVGGDQKFAGPYTFTLNAGGYVDLWCVLGVTNGADVWVTVDGSTKYSVRTTWPR